MFEYLRLFLVQVKYATCRHVEANSAYAELSNEAAELKRVSC